MPAPLDHGADRHQGEAAPGQRRQPAPQRRQGVLARVADGDRGAGPARGLLGPHKLRRHHIGAGVVIDEYVALGEREIEDSGGLGRDGACGGARIDESFLSCSLKLGMVYPVAWNSGGGQIPLTPFSKGGIKVSPFTKGGG